MKNKKGFSLRRTLSYFDISFQVNWMIKLQHSLTIATLFHSSFFILHFSFLCQRYHHSASNHNQYSQNSNYIRKLISKHYSYDESKNNIAIANR